MAFDWYVQGLWIFGSVLLFLGALIAGNVEFVEGATEISFGLSVILAFILLLLGGMMLVSSAVNARHEERIYDRLAHRRREFEL